MNTFRLAKSCEIESIWKIIQGGIERRKKEGSTQWQNGYPNLQTLENDMKNNQGYVLLYNDEIAVYCALLINNEPAYTNIEGSWLSDEDFVVAHRIVVSEKYTGKGLGQITFDKIELFAEKNNIRSIKIDTNYDNDPMLYLLNKNGYNYCGEVFYNNSPRKAFEKLLNN